VARDKGKPEAAIIDIIAQHMDRSNAESIVDHVYAQEEITPDEWAAKARILCRAMEGDGVKYPR
jgi:hypothetical protein